MKTVVVLLKATITVPEEDVDIAAEAIAYKLDQYATTNLHHPGADSRVDSIEYAGVEI